MCGCGINVLSFILCLADLEYSVCKVVIYLILQRLCVKTA